MTVDDLLARARAKLVRPGPEEVAGALGEDAVLVDIRPADLRERDGVVPDAVIVGRNVLEWRCDPASPDREPAISDPSKRVVVMCDEGYASSLAAATLQELGLPHATDLDGGFQAWRAAGLPVRPADG